MIGRRCEQRSMASDATELKHAKELVTLYRERYVNHYGKAPLINTHRDLWGFRRMFGDLGKANSVLVIEDYFLSKKKFNHSLSELFNNYDRFFEAIEENEALTKKDEETRRETEQRVKEWKAQIGESPGTAP